MLEVVEAVLERVGTATLVELEARETVGTTTPGKVGVLELEATGGTERARGADEVPTATLGTGGATEGGLEGTGTTAAEVASTTAGMVVRRTVAPHCSRVDPLGQQPPLVQYSPASQ